MAAGFGGVRQYVGWLIFINKVRSDVLLRREDGFMKKVPVTFSVPKLINQWPGTITSWNSERAVAFVKVFSKPFGQFVK